MSNILLALLLIIYTIIPDKAAFPQSHNSLPEIQPEASVPPPPHLSEYEISQQYGRAAETAIPALLEALTHSEASIRRNAAFALGEMGPDAKTAIEDLAEALRRDPDIEVRRNAAFALGEIGSPSIPVLIRCLNDKDSRVRRNVSSALVRIGTPTVPYLVKALAVSDPITRRNAAGILGRIGPKAKEAIPALTKALDDDDKSFCWTVKQALKNIKRVTVEDLIENLSDKNAFLRNDSAKSLGALGEDAQDAVPALIACLNDEKAPVRRNASFALAQIGVPAIPALIEALNNENSTTRKNAAFSLGEMRQKAAPAVPALKKILHDPHAKVRWCADIALGKIKGATE